MVEEVPGMSRMRTPWTPRRSASCVVSKYTNSWPQANYIHVSPVHCMKMELKRLKAIGHAPIADCEPLEAREVESTLPLVLNSAENRSFVYYQSPNAGLIEMDEAPPLEHDEDAVEVALTMAAMMSAKPVGALQAMRKTVVDGSNTSGFQRTTLIGTHGSIQTPSGPVGVDVICLEEDSARKLDTRSTHDGEQVVYTLDRLGVPLVEVATAPDVQTPEHAKETALALGTSFATPRRVRRGLGSIRQT